MQGRGKQSEKILYKSSAVAEMGDRLAIDMGRKLGRVPHLGGSWAPSKCHVGRGLPPYQVAS